MMPAHAASNTGAASIRQHAVAAAIVAAVVFSACLLGILTRPVGFLAAFWPANAILLGLMLRVPSLAVAGGWLGAFVGYIAADVVTGTQLGITLWLTLANMSGAITGYLLFKALPVGDSRLKRPVAVLYLFVICLAAAAVAAMVGGGAARALFDRSLSAGLEFWFVTELVNNLVILPTIMTFPSASERAVDPEDPWSSPSLTDSAPVIALLFSAGIGVWIGGPGAIAFSVPALLWCALSYSLFKTSVLTTLFCSWLLIAVSAGIISIQLEGDMLAATSSLRLGVALITLAPLMAASINATRTELLVKMAHAANHDSLTGALNRQAFTERAEKQLTRSREQRQETALLMIDIDHFKSINDRHGHAAGDAALVRFAQLVAGSLRPSDLFGRIGGEEFAVLLPNLTAREATDIAERIRKCIAAMEMNIGGVAVPVTASIGVASAAVAENETIISLMARADSALYSAKSDGRNLTRVEMQEFD